MLILLGNRIGFKALDRDGVQTDRHVEGRLEVEDRVKVTDRIAFGRLHQSAVDHGEDDLAEVVGAVDVPPAEHGAGQPAVLLDGEIAQAFGKLLAADVALLLAEGFGILMDAVDGKVQPATHEVKRVQRVARRADDVLQTFGFSLGHGDYSIDGFAATFSPGIILKMTNDPFMAAAIDEARKGLAEGGIPIGSVLVRNDQIIGRGHNRRVQDGDPITHAEIDALRNAGRVGSYRRCVLYSTLMPCYLCSGAAVQFEIPKVIVGESETFPGAPDFMRSHGIEVIDLGLEECKDLMRRFIAANPQLWHEDIGEL